MLPLYETLVSKPVKETPSCAAEKRSKYLYISERHIQALWWEQIYFIPLHTSAGLPIKVLSPGQWNNSSGPDFKKAHLLIGDKELRGDIEIHLSDEGWDNHGHQKDAAYDETILHVALWNPIHTKKLKTSQGKELHQTYLETQLTIPVEKIPYLIDADLYPYKPHLGTGKCSSAIFTKLSKEEAEKFFASAAFWRLSKKGEHLLAIASTKAESLKASLARALGFPNNSSAFLKLFQTLAANKNQSPEYYQAQALGLCGFFEEDYQKKWNLSYYYNHLHTLWKDSANNDKRIPLNPQRTRPLHHPIRRIAALSHLLADSSLDQLYDKLNSCWNDQNTICHTPKHWRYLWNSLLQQLPHYVNPYWNKHYFFEQEAQNQPLPLLGEQIKHEMILNVVLPALYSLNNKEENYNKFWALYKGINTDSTSKSRYLKNRFYGNQTDENLFKKAYVTQGAFQVHNDFCRHFETSCIGCPFIERFEKIETKIK